MHIDQPTTWTEVTGAGEGTSRTAGKTHPPLIVSQILHGNASQGTFGRLDTYPLFGAGDKNLSFSCKYFYEE